MQNTHGAFNLFGNHPALLVGLSFLVLAGFWWAFRDMARRSRVVRLAFGALLGGAAGNMSDRLHYHFVVDFIDFRTIWQWVFNIADASITLGVAVLIVQTLRLRKRERATQLT